MNFFQDKPPIFRAKNVSFLRCKLTQKFFDTKTGHSIAVAKAMYAGKKRNLAISYDILEDSVEIITIHPISEEDLKSRVQNKRWDKQ